MYTVVTYASRYSVHSHCLVENLSGISAALISSKFVVFHVFPWYNFWVSLLNRFAIVELSRHTLLPWVEVCVWSSFLLFRLIRGLSTLSVRCWLIIDYNTLGNRLLLLLRRNAETVTPYSNEHGDQSCCSHETWPRDMPPSRDIIHTVNEVTKPRIEFVVGREGVFNVLFSNNCSTNLQCIDSFGKLHSSTLTYP